MKNTRSVMMQSERLSIKKSIKRLKDILVWSMMILWIFFLTVLLSSSANAQTAQLDWDKPVILENREYRLIDIDDMGHATVQYKEYNTEGNLVVEGLYYNQKPDGIWVMYNEDGTVISRAVYVNGRIRKHNFVSNDRKMTVKYSKGRREYICSF